MQYRGYLDYRPDTFIMLFTDLYGLDLHIIFTCNSWLDFPELETPLTQNTSIFLCHMHFAYIVASVIDANFLSV